MSDKEFDEIHDYDYNKGFEESDITRSEITIDNHQSDISSPSEPETTSRSMFSNQNKNTSSSVFDNEATMNMIQENVVNSIGIEELREQQNFPLGLIGGVVASFLCIFIWTLITVLTKYQITYMAIGVGFAVGFSIQKLGKGITPVYGILGAALALLTCFVGNFLSSVCLIADELNYTYSEMFSSLDVDTSILIIKETFQFMDIIFYGIAIYTGYLCSVKSES